MTDETTNPVESEAVAEAQTGVDEGAEELESLLRGSTDEGEGDDDSPSEEDELEEVEFDGKKGKVSKALKDGYLRQADYTRKTQELAEQRKEVEAAKASAGQLPKEMIEGLADVRSISKQLEDIGKLTQEDWDQIDALDAQDGGNRARRLERQRQALTAAHAEAVGKLQTQERERSETAQRERAKRLQEADAMLAKDIKGWGPERAQKIAEFAKTQGFTPAEVAELDDPRHVKILDLAMEGLNARSRAAKAAKAEAATASTPAPTVKGSGAPVKTLSQAAKADDFASFEKLAQKAIRR